MSLFPALGSVLFLKISSSLQVWTVIVIVVIIALQRYSRNHKGNLDYCPPGNKMQGKEEG